MKKKSFIVIVILLIAIILGLCVFIAYDKNLFGIKGEKKESSNTVEKNSGNYSNKSSDLDTGSKLFTIDFDGSKSLNTDTNKINYKLTSGWIMDGISVSCDKKKCEITINWDIINEKYFSLNQNKSGIEGVNINNISSNVVDIFIGSMGNSASNGTLFFLLDDGNIEFIPLFYALKNYDIKSYGKIEGVENVIKLLSVGVSGNGTDVVGGYHSIVALRSDGSFYDLTENLASLQYYSEG